MVLKRIGLTGATGMLGRHLAAALKVAGAEVVAVSRAGSGNSGSKGWDLADWRTSEQLDDAFSCVQAVVHAGAMVPTAGAVDEGRMFDTNVRALANLGLWGASRRVPIVYISGSVVYADPTAERLSEDSPLGWSGFGGFYSLTKLFAEDVLTRLTEQGLKRAVVRPSSIYGFGLSPTKVLISFLTTARDGGIITLTPPVNDRVDFVHAADVSRAVVEILRADAWDTFNVASGCPLSMLELAEACVSATGRGGVATDHSPDAQREPMTRFALDTTRARTRVGWRPRVDIHRGLRMMLESRVV